MATKKEVLVAELVGMKKRINEILIELGLPEEKLTKTKKSKKLAINEVLRDTGISTKVKGYRYLRDILLICTEKDEYIDLPMTKYLYPLLAEKYNNSWQVIERGIYNAIRSRKDTKTISFEYEPPATKEFITKIYELVLLKLEE